MGYISNKKITQNRKRASQIFPEFKKQIAIVFFKAMCKPVETISYIVYNKQQKQFDVIENDYTHTVTPATIILNDIEAYGHGDEPDLVDWFVNRGFPMSDVPDLLKDTSDPYILAGRFESDPASFYDLVLQDDQFEIQLFSKLQEMFPHEFKDIKF